MNLLRATALLLVAAWSATAGGLAGALHVCQMSEEPTECFCPHSEKKQAAEATIERGQCCDVHTSFAASVPAVTDGSRLASLLAAPAVVPAHLLAPPSQDALAQSALQLRDVPWSHGPPLFLKIRTLLI